ncbi:FAD-dependent oxidoreductase [Sanguibacter sp. 4.1]|uniref:FAD-dependent oxidoreductase n=1 Tax=Sanguibacter biliveldensis TaxID=3030830 RepID=A0AAF0Z507_9MICO|nr:FAD-dependent oxidoreductase [Sanguibacter sp. 4.1]WPF82179.1 FAD-dependent oxidoreductase [Sanguibacter sp. 4.1]
MTTIPSHDGTPAPVLDAVVVGGGIAGLVAARTLVADGFAPVVVEASEICGGYLARADVGPAGVPVVVDSGAESYASRSQAIAALVAELGLEAVEPSGLSAWGYVPEGTGPRAAPRRPRGRAFPLPKAGVLGIPGHVWASDTCRAIGVVGALRASLDRVLPASRVDTSTLASLVESRLGRRVLDRLVTPVAGGVHSTDPALLSVDAVAPGLLTAYERTGSLAAAVRSLRAQAPAGSAVRGLVGGMNQLVAALETAVEAGGSIRRSTGARQLRRTGDVWEVRLTTGETLRTARVVLAVGGHTAVALLGDLVDTAGAAPVRGTDIRLVTLVLRAPALGDAPRGTGVLVAPGSDVVAKGSTHASAKWPWLRKRLDATLGPDAHVVRLSYGRGGAGPAGADLDAAAPDETFVTQAVLDVQALYGVPLASDDVLSSAVTRWDDALSPPTPAHRARTSRLVSDVAALGSSGAPGLSVTGAWVAGTGLAAVVPHAQAAARSLDLS